MSEERQSVLDDLSKTQLVSLVQSLQEELATSRSLRAPGGAHGLPPASEESELRTRVRNLDLLASMARSLMTTVDPADVAKEVFEWIQSFMPHAACRVWVIEDDGRSRRCIGSLGFQSTDGDIALPPGQGVGGLAAESRQTVICADIINDPRFVKKDWARTEGLVSCISLPLIHHERIYGTLSVFTRERREPVGSQLTLLESFAAQVAAALANAALMADAVRKTVRLEALNRVSAAVVGTHSLDEVLRMVVSEAAELLGQEGAALRLLENDRLIMASEFGLQARIPIRPSVAVGESLSGRVAEERRPITVSDLGQSDDMLPDHKSALMAQGVRRWIGVPVTYQARLIGVLISTGRSSRSFTSDDVSLMSAFADHAAVAIENGRLYRELQQKTRSLEALNRLSAGIVGNLERDDIIKMIVEEGPKLLRLDGGGLRMLEGDRLVLVRQGGISQRLMVKRSLALGESLSGRVALNETPITISELQENTDVTPEHKAAVLAEGARCWIGVPVRYRGRLTGVLVAAGRERRTFTEDDVQLLSAFADHAAIAMENSRLYRDAQQELGERKRVEAELREHQDRLQELVRERTAALEETQVQLLRNERLAALGQLTGSVSHELRTPLGTIRASLDVIDDALDKGLPVSRRAVSRALRNVTRCNGIISELLDFARAPRLDLKTTALGTWLREVLGELDFPEGIEIVTSFDESIEVAIDEARLRRAVSNVVENAIQALSERRGEDDGRRISVGCVRDDARIMIDVRDNGPGMVGEVLAQVLEPLFSTKGFGIGLGLPIVSKIMEQHGGGLEIDSQPGTGTRVRLWLPATRDG